VDLTRLLKVGVAMLAQKRRIALWAVLSVALMTFNVHALQVSLSWTAPTTNQDGTSLNDLAGYKVYYGLATRSYDVAVDTGLSTSAVLSGLQDGRTYYFAVTAYDTSGNQSAFSAEIAYPNPLTDTDGDGLTDQEELTVYGTNPAQADTDGDGINDGAEIAFWGANWNADADGDGRINLLDNDSDNDGFLDSVERSQGTNPADPSSVPGAGRELIAVNAGGSSFTAADGTSYQADTLFSGGSTHKTKAAIAGTTDDALYQSERYGSFTYNIPVANGDYVVTLKFAELYFSATGRRVFDVLIEGGKVVNNLDVFAQVGKNTAYDVTVSVRVTDAMLNITFRSIINYAKVNAIVISTP
jgi:hypothetical protein